MRVSVLRLTERRKHVTIGVVCTGASASLPGYGSRARRQGKPSSPEVPLEKLHWRCDPEIFPFDTTADLPPLEGIIGQERAQKALALGLEIARTGYNIYVCGMPGTGRMTAVQQLLAACQERATPPPDLCYVFAFKHPERPRLLTLQAEQGKT